MENLWPGLWNGRDSTHEQRGAEQWSNCRLGGSVADRLWDSGKPQSQSPEETAEEGGAWTARGRGASCFIRGLIAFLLRKRTRAPICTWCAPTPAPQTQPRPRPAPLGFWFSRAITHKLEQQNGGNRLHNGQRVYRGPHTMSAPFRGGRHDRHVRGSAVPLAQLGRYCL